jgi:hypothetical protein
VRMLRAKIEGFQKKNRDDMPLPELGSKPG